MIDLGNGTTYMSVRQVAESVAIREKQFQACDSSEMSTKIETVLEQASIHVNYNKHSKKSSKQYSYKQKHKRCKIK